VSSLRVFWLNSCTHLLFPMRATTLAYTMMLCDFIEFIIGPFSEEFKFWNFPSYTSLHPKVCSSHARFTCSHHFVHKHLQSTFFL
jgi:hypothetical protein